MRCTAELWFLPQSALRVNKVLGFCFFCFFLFCIGTGGCTEFPVSADLRRLLHAIGSGPPDVGLRLRVRVCPLRTQARIYSSFLMMQLCKGGFASVRKEEIRAIRVEMPFVERDLRC